MDTSTVGAQTAPGIDEAFVADRQAFWLRFTKFVTRAAIVVAVIVILMAIFLT